MEECKPVSKKRISWQYQWSIVLLSWRRIGDEQHLIGLRILQRSFETGQYSHRSHRVHWKQPLLLRSTRNSPPVLQVCPTFHLQKYSPVAFWWDSNKRDWKCREVVSKPCLYGTKNSNTQMFCEHWKRHLIIWKHRYSASCRNTQVIAWEFNLMALYELAMLSLTSNSLIATGSTSHHLCLH